MRLQYLIKNAPTGSAAPILKDIVSSEPLRISAFLRWQREMMEVRFQSMYNISDNAHN